MKIRYSLTWKEYSRYLSWRMSKFSRRDRLMAFGVLPLIFMLLIITQAFDVYRLPGMLAFHLKYDACLILLITLWMPLDWMMEAWRRHLEIGLEGVAFNPVARRILLPWKTIQLLDEDADLIYLAFEYRPFRLARVGQCYILIPKRAFPSAGEAERFYETAQIYCREAGAHPTASVYAVRPLPAQ